MSPKPILYGDAVHWGLIQADALLMLARMPENSVDAILTDPPYGIDFGDQAWDGQNIRQVVTAKGERISANAAFERWTRVWATEATRVLRPGGHLVSFGAPRTFHRLTCGIEDAALEIRDVMMWLYASGVPKSRRMAGGQGTALKPAYEPILLARAPLGGSVARNLEEWGVGALNVDAARIQCSNPSGYWPANITLSHTPVCRAGRCGADCPVGLLDAHDPDKRPSRFFYCAKASRQEREAGCEELSAQPIPLYNGRPTRMVRNTHIAVKPIQLLRWLVRLTCPPHGLVLDPFTGSGSTGIAAMLERRRFMGIEREPEYVRVARARLTYWRREAGKEGAW